MIYGNFNTNNIQNDAKKRKYEENDDDTDIDEKNNDEIPFEVEKILDKRIKYVFLIY